MSIIDSVKDTARKATNSVVDTAENIMNKPKSPTELASRLVEHLSHEEYDKIAEILSEEVKKYASKLGIDDFAPTETKLDDLEDGLKNVAKDLEDGDYGTVATKIKQAAASIPNSIVGNTDIPKFLKNLLKDIVKVVEGYNQEKIDFITEGKKPDFSKLQDVFEDNFNKLLSK